MTYFIFFVWTNALSPHKLCVCVYCRSCAVLISRVFSHGPVQTLKRFCSSASPPHHKRQKDRGKKRQRKTKIQKRLAWRTPFRLKKKKKRVCSCDSLGLIWCLYSQDPLTLQSRDVEFVGGSGSVWWHMAAVWWHVLATPRSLSSASGIGCAVSPLQSWSCHPHAPPLWPPDPCCAGAHSTPLSASPPTLGALPSTKDSR